MLEHETQAAFLKVLIAYEAGEASLRLRDDLAKAERERKCIRRAILLTVMLFILSVSGLSYCALLLPHVYSNPSHFATVILSVLALASLICQLEFFGYLLWHRVAANRLLKECRRRVLLLAEPRLRASLRGSPSVDLCQEAGSTVTSAQSGREEEHRQNQRYESAAPGGCQTLEGV
jgi:hypothetical protein